MKDLSDILRGYCVASLLIVVLLTCMMVTYAINEDGGTLETTNFNASHAQSTDTSLKSMQSEALKPLSETEVFPPVEKKQEIKEEKKEEEKKPEVQKIIEPQTFQVKGSDGLMYDVNNYYRKVFDYMGGMRGQDFTPVQLSYLYDLCKEKEIPIEICIAIMRSESNFCSWAANDYTDAAGYFQVVSVSAEYAYEKILQYGEYDIENHVEIQTSNWRLNMDTASSLMRWLYEIYGDYHTMVMRYSGSYSEEWNERYADKIEGYITEFFGKKYSDFGNG